LLISLSHSLITTAKPTDDATHGRSGSRPLSSVAGYGTANGSQRRAATGTLQNMRLRGPILLRRLRARSLRHAGVEPGLFYGPGMAFVPILVLLLLVLALRGVDKHIGLRASRCGERQERTREGDLHP
jgi:hypothetical protein